MGNIIESTGSNNETIAERVNKSHGIVRDIGQIMEGCFFGDHSVEALKLMRNSKLVSVLTYNLEVIHNIDNTDIQRLDKVDLILLRNTMMISSKSARCLILLELGLIPIKYLIMQKRINFLHHLLNSEGSLAKLVLAEQRKRPLKGDFVKLVKKDMSECDMTLTFEDIETIPKTKFKELLKEAIKKATFKNLLNEKDKISKGIRLE